MTVIHGIDKMPVLVTLKKSLMMERNYELIILIDPDEQRDVVIASVENLLSELQFEVIDQDIWKLRTLAYPIKKKTRGRYVVFTLKAQTSLNIGEFNRELLIMDGVMRHNLVLLRR